MSLGGGGAAPPGRRAAPSPRTSARRRGAALAPDGPAEPAPVLCVASRTPLRIAGSPDLAARQSRRRGRRDLCRQHRFLSGGSLKVRRAGGVTSQAPAACGHRGQLPRPFAPAQGHAARAAGGCRHTTSLQRTRTHHLAAPGGSPRWPVSWALRGRSCRRPGSPCSPRLGTQGAQGPVDGRHPHSPSPVVAETLRQSVIKAEPKISSSQGPNLRVYKINGACTAERLGRENAAEPLGLRLCAEADRRPWTARPVLPPCLGTAGTVATNGQGPRGLRNTVCRLTPSEVRGPRGLTGGQSQVRPLAVAL